MLSTYTLNNLIKLSHYKLIQLANYCVIFFIDERCVFFPEINACSSNLCQNGTCVADGDDYTCRCDPGWTADHCDGMLHFEKKLQYSSHRAYCQLPHHHAVQEKHYSGRQGTCNFPDYFTGITEKPRVTRDQVLSHKFDVLSRLNKFMVNVEAIYMLINLSCSLWLCSIISQFALKS